MLPLHTRAAPLFGWTIRAGARERRVAIVAFLALAADRCFASFDDLMRPGRMRPK
jgi:hypothetical protein